MQGDEIPDSDHVSRYCKPSSISLSTGRPTGASFRLRENEAFLSINWLEELNQTSRESEINELRQVFKNKPFQVATTGVFAVINVGRTKSSVVEGAPDSTVLKFIHEPEDDDPSHSGIFGFTHEENLIAELIADSVIETHDARQR